MNEFDSDRELVDRLRDLPTEADPATDLWPGVETRVAGRRRPTGLWSHFALLAAASVIFVAGLGSGLAIAATRAPTTEPTLRDAMQLASEVQRTGTQYVAALAAFAVIVDSLSVEVRDQGRQAAFATLLGATQEWAALNGGATVIRSVNNEQEKLPTVRF